MPKRITNSALNNFISYTTLGSYDHSYWSITGDSLMQCLGRNNDDHCCYINNEPCQFLEENVDGFKWGCQLRRETGSWDAAVADPRYDNGEGSPGFHFKQFAYGDCRNFQCDACSKMDANP